MPAARPFNPGLLVDDEGQPYQAQGGTIDAIWGSELLRKYEQDRNRDWWARAAEDPNIARAGKPHPRPSALRTAGWEGFSGIMRGKANAAEAQGRTFRVKGAYGNDGDDTMPTNYSARPSMRSLGAMSGMQQAAADGWEHPDVRAAKLRIVQEQGNAMTDERLDRDRMRDPSQRAYETEQQDKIDVASAERRMPIYTRGREEARRQGSMDTIEGANVRQQHPFFKEEREFTRGLARDRASMDAFARILGSIRPETAELFENNPALMDVFRGAFARPSASAAAPGGAGAVPGTGTGQPTSPERDASPVYEPGTADGTIPPVVRLEIEQWLRENNYTVNDRNLQAAYTRLQQQQ